MSDDPDRFVGDEIGPWSEVKLEIIRRYAVEYSKILSAQRDPRFLHAYIDAFAGAGHHRSKLTGAFVPGSPMNALLVQPPFREYFFVDLQETRVHELQALADGRPDVHVFHGDANQVLLRDVFPRIRYEEYRRALCVLDPYGMQLAWEVIRAAGQSRSIELFVNFPIGHAINRNVLRRDARAVDPVQAARMDVVWGDPSWRGVSYAESPQLNLFESSTLEKQTNPRVGEAFRRRLREVASFSHVPEPMPMRNSQGALLYYLYFASHRPVAGEIVEAIFDRYRRV